MKSRNDFNTDYEWLEYYRHFAAAMAMNGLCANEGWMKKHEGQKYLMQSDVLAEVSIESADYLIAALNKLQTEGDPK